MTDQLQKFLFNAAPVRGELVRIEASWQEVLRRRAYPPAVQRLLGEMVAAATLLSANLKFNGALVMQLHGDGPVQMLVVECRADLSFRATAKLAEGMAIADEASLTEMVNVLGKGRFAITLDPQDKKPGQQPYQGIVPLNDKHNQPLPHLAAVLEHYMQASEQLDSQLHLAADNTTCAGMLLQRLPDHGGTHNPTLSTDKSQEEQAEAWNRLCALGGTLGSAELLATDSETLLRRLFLEESEMHGVRVFEPQAVSFVCSCTRAKVANMLQMLGQAEIESLLSEREKVDVDCEFCGQHYTFDAVDCAQVFMAGAASVTLDAGTAH